MFGTQNPILQTTHSLLNESDKMRLANEVNENPFLAGFNGDVPPWNCRGT